MKLLKKLLKNKTVLITAGPTREPIDAVRFLSNRSSGKMGYALAKVAKENKARVILISGPVSLPAPKGVRLISVETAGQMLKAIINSIKKADLLMMAAAVSDFTPRRLIKTKIKRSHSLLLLKLKPTPDILKAINRKRVKHKKGLIKVGFAAETSSLLLRAYQKLKEKELDVMVANDISRRDIGFDSDYNQVCILRRDKPIIKTKILPKEEIARQIFVSIIS